jgi:hypothetical protein
LSLISPLRSLPSPILASDLAEGPRWLTRGPSAR